MIVGKETIEQPMFYLVGLSIRTTNQNGQSQEDIGGLWGRIMQGNLLEIIDDRASGDTYCVYTDYETDHTGYYTAVIGCKVNSLDHIAEGFTGITIAAGKYQVYEPKGKFPEKVHKAWVEIWNSNVNRAYTADFDLYSPNANGFEETEVKIYLAVR